MLDTEADVMRAPHPWTGRQAPTSKPNDLRRVRAKIVELATQIVATCPPGPERQEALEHLDAVAFHVVGAFRNRS